MRLVLRHPFERLIPPNFGLKSITSCPINRCLDPHGPGNLPVRATIRTAVCGAPGSPYIVQMYSGESQNFRTDPVAMTDTLFRTANFRALDFDFCVESTEEALCNHLNDIYAPLRSGLPATNVYRFIDVGPSPGKDRYFAFFGEERLASGPVPAFPIGYVLWHINHQAVTTNSQVLLLHAACAEQEGRAVILPAPADSGKTTLVAGLVRRGLRYITDEAVALCLHGDRRVLPYPKPLTIERGSWDVLADLRPAVEEIVPGYVAGQWHVSPEAIRRGATGDRAIPRFVVVPRYAADGPTTLTPLKRVEALRLLAESTFNLETFGRRGFETLARLVRDCDCYQLSVADLERACQLVLGLFDAPDGTL